METTKKIGGSFAPKMTQEKIERYRDLIASVTDRKIKDTLEPLVDMVEAFLQTPDTTLEGKDLNVHLASGTKTIQMQPLEQAEIERMWDLVPYPEECEAIGKIIANLQIDAANENSRRIEAWQRGVHDMVVAKHFGSVAELVDVVAYLRAPDSFKKFFTNGQLAHFESMEQKLAECNAELQYARGAKSHPDFPYPELESTELRDAAYHLYWYANELSVDREPLTADKL